MRFAHTTYVYKVFGVSFSTCKTKRFSISKSLYTRISDDLNENY